MVHCSLSVVLLDLSTLSQAFHRCEQGYKIQFPMCMYIQLVPWLELNIRMQ